MDLTENNYKPQASADGPRAKIATGSPLEDEYIADSQEAASYRTHGSDVSAHLRRDIHAELIENSSVTSSSFGVSSSTLSADIYNRRHQLRRVVYAMLPCRSLDAQALGAASKSAALSAFPRAQMSATGR